MRSLLEEYTNYLINVKKVSDNTVAAYSRDLKKMTDYMAESGVSEVKGISEDRLNSYIKMLMDSGHSDTSVKRNMTSIKSFFKFLIDNGDLEDNPSENLKCPRVKKTPPRILEVDEIDGLLSQKFSDDAKGKRDRAILELLYATGLKVSEIIGLTLSNVDMSISCLRLNGKRLIPYGAKAKEALNEYFLNGRNFYLSQRDGDSDLVFFNYNGEPMSRQGLWKLIKSYVKKSGMDKDITVSSIRHSFAKHMLENGADASSLQEMMGYNCTHTITRYMDKEQKIKDPYYKSRLRNV